MADLYMPHGLLLLAYADPKVGKTTLFLRAFPNAICIGIRSAIELVAMNTCGIKPHWIVDTVTDLPGLVGFLLHLKAHPDVVRQYGAILVDDFSQMCNVSMLRWDAEAPTSVKRGPDKFYKYQMLDKHLDQVSSLLRELGIPAGMSAHESKPDSEKDRKGAPEVPSGNQVQSVPGWADLVARVVRDPASLDPFWQGALFVDPTSNWITGDRFGICSTTTPANLREILRASQGHLSLPRFPSLEWQDEWATHVFDMLESGTPPLAAAEAVWKHFGAYAAPDTPGDLHVLWAVQDGIARHAIRRQRAGGVLGRALAAAQARANATAAPPPPPAPKAETKA